VDVGSSLFEYSRGFHEQSLTTIAQFRSLGVPFTLALPYIELIFFSVIYFGISKKMPNWFVKEPFLWLFFIVIIALVCFDILHLIAGIQNLWYDGF
jgi:hypothetical protein